MLAHCTTPSCVSANILTIIETLFPNHLVIHERPSLRFVHASRTILLQVTKTLAAYQIGKTQTVSQLFSDGTSRHQTSIQHIIIGMLTDGGYKAVMLSTSILLENETSE
jgi:hypothetical protein